MVRSRWGRLREVARLWLWMGGPRAISGVGPAFTLLLAATLSVSLLASAAGWRVLATAGGSRIGIGIVLAAVAGGWWWLHRARSHRTQLPVRASLVASAPGLLVAGIAVASLAWPLSARAGWFFGGDHVRHLVFVAQIHADGVLDYSTNEYPRAWQALLAMVWSALGQSADIPGVMTLIELMSFAVWLLHALLSLTVGQLGESLARRAGAGPRRSGMAGLVAGCISLWPTFLSNYQVLGFENSIVAMVLLTVAARELLERPSSLQCLVVNAATWATLAHVWQLLLPVAAAGCAASAVAMLRRRRRNAAIVVVAGTLSSMAAWPGISAAIQRVGLGSAVYANVPSPIPSLILPVSLVSLVVVLVRLRRDPRIYAFASLVGITVATALAVAWRVGIPVTQYYPSKLLWTAGVLGLAPLGVTVTHAVSGLRSRTGPVSTSVRLTTVMLGGLLLAYSAAGPLFPLLGPSATADGPTTLGALSTPGAPSANVVWLPRPTPEETRFDSTTARLMLDVFVAAPGMTYRDQRSPSLQQECAILQDADQPTVLSSAPTEVVRRRYGCAPGLTILPVRPYGG